MTNPPFRHCPVCGNHVGTMHEHDCTFAKDATGARTTVTMDQASPSVVAARPGSSTPRDRLDIDPEPTDQLAMELA